MNLPVSTGAGENLLLHLFASPHPGVQDAPHHHLMEIGAMILAVAQLADGLASLSLEVDGGGVEKDAIQTAKKIPARQEQILLDHVLCAARGEGGAILLVLELLSQEGHRPVEMMQRQGVEAVDHIIPMPPVKGPVPAGDEETR